MNSSSYSYDDESFIVKDLDSGESYNVEDIDQHYSIVNLDLVAQINNLGSKEDSANLLSFYTTDKTADSDIEFISSSIHDTTPSESDYKESNCRYTGCGILHFRPSGYCDEHEIKAKEDEDARAQALFFIPNQSRAEFEGITSHGFARDHMGRIYTVYTLELTCKESQSSWKVYRRYQEFKTLNDQLRVLGFRTPVFPPKKLFGSFEPEFISRRQTELSNWFDQILQISTSDITPHDTEELRRFLTWKVDQPPFPISSVPNIEEDLPRSRVIESGSSCNSACSKDGVRLSDFEMIQVIGRGSFGRVVLVGHKGTKKKYAMKILSKSNIVKRKQVEHTRTERRVLSYTKHPFIVGLHYAFQTPQRLYFILDYCPGGELFYHLTRMRKLPELMARFYVAEITLALEHLHSLGIIYRDLKPENILLDKQGHIKLADFGLAKEGITEGTIGTNSLCGTPEYLPPEILDRAGHGSAVDWWNLGMVLFEMLTGLPPWYTNDRQRLFDRLRTARLIFPPYVSRGAENLIRQLLKRNPDERLGARGASEVKNHSFFDGINWDSLYHKRIRPPFDPCRHTNDNPLNFEVEFTRLPFPSVEMSDSLKRTKIEADPFAGFAYENPVAFDMAKKSDYLP